MYEVECADGHWYVGTTRRELAARLREHKAGPPAGAAWTWTHRPLRDIKLVREFGSPEDANLFETRRTLELMREHGVDLVRGGQFAQVELSDEVREHIKSTMSHTFGLCLFCMQPGHFSSRCPHRGSGAGSGR